MIRAPWRVENSLPGGGYGTWIVCVKVRMTLCGVEFRVAEHLALEPALPSPTFPKLQGGLHMNPKSQSLRIQYYRDIPVSRVTLSRLASVSSWHIRLVHWIY